MLCAASMLVSLRLRLGFWTPVVGTRTVRFEILRTLRIIQNCLTRKEIYNILCVVTMIFRGIL